MSGPVGDSELSKQLEQVNDHRDVFAQMLHDAETNRALITAADWDAVTGDLKVVGGDLRRAMGLS